jgi:hypothetical protein
MEETGCSETSEFYMPTFRNTLFHLQVEETECSEKSAYKIQTPGNYPEEIMQHSEHGESFKPRISASVSLATPKTYIVPKEMIMLRERIKHKLYVCNVVTDCGC